METIQKYKMGDVREDGMVFIEYKWKRNNPEYWSTPEQYAKRLEKARAKQAVWAIKNKEKTKENNKKYREANKQKVQEYHLKYYAENSDKIKQRTRIWAKENSERISSKKKIYRNKNKESINRYFYLRRENDFLFRISQDMRSLIGLSIRKKKFSKTSKTENILGCSFEEFFTHIESQFIDGMSWENRSLWHIDHIIPLATAKTEEEILRLNHYTNLRPLWALDNLKKGSKILC
jgi:hypothetical protein